MGRARIGVGDMERAVFIIAVTAAILIGACYLIGPQNWSFSIGDDFELDPVVVAPAEHTAPQTFADAAIDIDHIAARVTITPEERTDISVEIDNPGGVPTPTVAVLDGEILIDGHLRGRIQDCLRDGARVRGYGVLAATRLPQIIIRTPRNAIVSVGGAGVTQIGPAQALDVDIGGCGTAQISDVVESLNVDLRGSGEIHAGNSGALKAILSGSGNIVAGSTSALEIDLDGSGRVNVGAVTGDALVSVDGSGQAEIAAVSGGFESDIDGSGGIEVHGGAITLADVEVAGSGRIQIVAPVARLQVDIRGSGNVDVDAPVGDIDAEIGGSGSVNVQSVTGTVVKDIGGSGGVNIRG
jgi:Putative auto-transporter adhesin, head GIN domain